MNNILFHRILFHILCVLSLFGGNSLLAFQPEPTLEATPIPRQKFLGVTLSQNFAYRNYAGTELPYPFWSENYNNQIKPNFSFGLNFERPFSNHPYSASLKFKLLYEQFTSKLSQTLPYKDSFSDSTAKDFNYIDLNKVSQFCLQTSYIQRLFSTNLSFLFGGSVAFVQSDFSKNYFELNSISDTLIITSQSRPPYHRFSEDYSEYIVNEHDRGPNFRFTLNIGLQYDVHLEKLKIVPFVNYNHDFNSRFEIFNLLSFQTGIDVSFPIR